MNILWFGLGGLIVLSMWGLKSYLSKNKLKISWLSWLGTIIGLFLSFFSIAWLVTRRKPSSWTGLFDIWWISFYNIGPNQEKNY